MRGEWRTPEREALMRAEYAAATDAAGFLARINALPGVPGASLHTLRVWARALGLTKTPEARVAIMRDTQSRGGKTVSVLLAGKPRHRAVWTAQRDALFLKHYPELGASPAMLAILNAAPGRPVSGIEAMRCRAEATCVRMTPDALRRLRRETAARARALRPKKPPVEAPKVTRAEAPPMRRERPLPQVAQTPVPAELTAAQQAAIADAAMARRQEKARAMLAKKACPHAVASNARLPLREVFRLAGEMR